MKSIWCALLLLLPALSFAQQADAILGNWLNEEKDAKINIFRTTSGKYAGRLVWIKNALEDDGKTPRKDSKNPDSKLRDRELQNLIILTGFSYDDGQWEDGKIYDPKSGKTYSSKMKLKNGSLEIRGYVGVSMLGRTTVWTKAE